MRTLANALAPHSIRVNTVHPTAVNTMMAVNPPWCRSWRTIRTGGPHLQNPMPVALLEPEDISDAIAYLVSDAGEVRHRRHLPRRRRLLQQAMSDNESRTGRVAGKKVLITGAARGMGRSHAVRLAEEGADLILVDICESLPELEYPLATPEDLDETARLAEKHGGRVVTHVVDIRDEAALTKAVDDGVAELGGLDAAVANAGVLTVGTWDKTTQQQWRTVVDVNLIGTWNTCAAALPHLVERGGSLVNISSAAGLKGTPLHLPYTASKHGVVGLSRALANELAAQNVRVNTVHPTGVETGMRPENLQQTLAERRPDLDPDLPQRPACRHGGSDRYQQCGAVPGVRRVAICDRTGVQGRRGGDDAMTTIDIDRPSAADASSPK